MSITKSKEPTLHEVLSVLPTGKRKGKYECPACHEWHLVVNQKGGQVLVDCKTPREDCPKGAAWNRITEKLSKLNKVSRSNGSTMEQKQERRGFTVKDYCKLKGLSDFDLTFLSDVYEITYYDQKPAVAFPYGIRIDGKWEYTGTKLRLSEDSHHTIWAVGVGDDWWADRRGWRKAEAGEVRTVPYGLYQFQYPTATDGEFPKDLAIVEGESDVHTLRTYNIPALGISGKNGWKPEFADIDVIRNAERIFIVKELPTKEGDKSGEEFVQRVGKDLPPEKTFVLTLPVKDPSALHLQCLADPSQGFRAVFDAAIAEAQPFGPAVQKTENEPFNYSDSGNTKLLVKWYGENFRWVTDMEKFYVWNRSFLKQSKSGNELLPWTLDVTTKIEDEDWALSSESSHHRHAMISLSKGEREVWADKRVFNQNPMLLNVLNGTVDLETQTLREFRREDYLIGQAPILYDASAKCPKFDDFMNFTFGGDKEMIHWVDRALGYTLTGQTGEHIFFLCHGDGGNGKSTLFSLMRTILGYDLAIAGRFTTFTESKEGYEKPNYELANFWGKRLVTASEKSRTGILNEQLMKDITGGEEMMVRQIRGEPFPYKPNLKLWLGMNRLPTITGTDEGIWRRVRNIPFTQTVPKQRKILDYDQVLFREEASGILNRSLRGVRDWLAEGLEPIGAIAAATNEYRSSQNSVQRFIDDECVTGNPNVHIKCGTLYDAYKKWANEKGEYVMSNTELSQYLERHFRKDRVHGDGEHRYGIGLKADV